MKSLYDVFSTNKDFETEGVTLDFGVAKFKVRRAGGSNRRFATVFRNKTKPHAQALAANTLSEETTKKILIDVYFEAVMIGWEDVTDRKGQSMAFNRENFTQLMMDLPDLWDTLRDEAEKMKNFQDATVIEDGEALGK